jgi:nicotinate-nucleotide pyrophosphorylase (carboxylating)
MVLGDFSSIVQRALDEDLDGAGDLTSKAIVPAEAISRAVLVARSAGIIAGMTVAAHVFETVDPATEVSGVDDGASVEADDVIGQVSGPSRSILTAERTALNLLGRMSGVATATAEYVSAVAGTGAKITDTRKTIPGLRALDKYSVMVGGGVNHRMGLYDEVMIKDNHIVAAGDLGAAVAKARSAVGPEVKVTVEVDNLTQLAEALATDADRVLLDNMDVRTLRRAVEMVGGTLETEASGGVTIETVREIAETGVEFISVGWITHSAPQLDIALEFNV